MEEKEIQKEKRDKVKDLLKKYPNNAELGYHIRNLYRTNQKG
tara:strand:- start:259 stop:384 length:126 start_codon:yes stop_codon:yes gene_type:complete